MSQPNEDSIADAPPPGPVPPEPAERLNWAPPLLLFVVSVASVLWVGGGGFGVPASLGGETVNWYAPRVVLGTMALGWKFAVPLFAILLAHEFGHYIAARIHGVPASLPYFLPMPLSPFGTWGAIIGMPERIATPRALLDIGAAGPLAGLTVALPVLAVGLRWSTVLPIDPKATLEGQCLLYFAMKRLFVGPIPDGHDVFLHPVAFAGWVGLFITMINLLPSAQLDGGHIAYALLGKRQDQVANVVYWLLPLLFLRNFASLVPEAKALGGTIKHLEWAAASASFWMLWFVILTLIRYFGGAEHPPTDEGHELTGPRRAIAVGCLVLFVLLFMPMPFKVPYVE